MRSSIARGSRTSEVLGRRRSGVRRCAPECDVLYAVGLTPGSVAGGDECRGEGAEVIDLQYPFHGRWLVQNSPADRVPSHGTEAFGSALAIDFVPLGASGRATAPVRLSSLLRPEDPSLFPGFGREILAPHDGIVVAANDELPDHPAHRGIPSVRYALSQASRAREGWRALAGNHVMIQAAPGVVVVLCHLQQESLTIGPGQRVRLGEVVGRCGNTGNSTEPHVHVQVVDRAEVDDAIQPVPFTLAGALPHNGDVVNPA